MDTRAIIGGALSLALPTTMAFVACRGPSPNPQLRTGASSQSHQAARPGPSPATPSASATDSAATATSAVPPVNTVAVAAAAARSCSAPTTNVSNQPDGGVVFINAWRRQDAGNIDRLQGIVNAISAETDTFRCCFDVWASSHAGQDGKLMLKMELEPDGNVKSASIDDSRTNVDDKITRTCVIDVAKSLSYPASPSKSATLVEYPFVISAAAQ